MKPCAYFDYDEAAARDRLTIPVNQCPKQCAVCGFNPAVADKRTETIRKEIRRRAAEMREGV